MSDATADDSLARVNLDRLIAETHKLVAESAKLVAESTKMNAEAAKLRAEEKKFDRDRLLSPVQIVIAALTGVAAAAAAFGGLAGFKALGHAIGLA